MDFCEEKCIESEKVKDIRAKIPDDKIINEAAEIFKVLSDPTRLKVVTSLLHSEFCVCDLSIVCEISESAISHQLRILRNLKIVRNRREGKVVFYRLDDDHVVDLIESTIQHVASH